VRQACREEIKQGAHFIKIMANGGVASPNDPIHFLGYSRDEITAAVEEATNAGTYVAAHLYTDEAIRRAVECGLHSPEHRHLIRALNLDACLVVALGDAAGNIGQVADRADDPGGDDPADGDRGESGSSDAQPEREPKNRAGRPVACPGRHPITLSAPAALPGWPG